MQKKIVLTKKNNLGLKGLKRQVSYNPSIEIVWWWQHVLALIREYCQYYKCFFFSDQQSISHIELLNLLKDEISTNPNNRLVERKLFAPSSIQNSTDLNEVIRYAHDTSSIDAFHFILLLFSIIYNAGTYHYLILYT